MSAENCAFRNFDGKVRWRFGVVDRHAALVDAAQLVRGRAADVSAWVYDVYEVRCEDLRQRGGLDVVVQRQWWVGLESHEFSATVSDPRYRRRLHSHPGFFEDLGGLDHVGVVLPEAPDE